MTTPLFQDLPRLPDSEERHAWDVWGRDDQLGTINFIGAEEVRHACGSVRVGQVVQLGLPLDQPAPGLFPTREAYRHLITRGAHGRDDSIDGLFLQFSSHWDGLRHVRFRHHGFWGGRQDDDIDVRGDLGIEHWAHHGLMARGVLLDVAGYHEDRGTPLAPASKRALDPNELDDIARAEGVTIRPGDVVLLRTGWLSWFMSLDPKTRQGLRGAVGRPEAPLACPGLGAGRDVAAWLWNHRVAAVAADNPTVESLPVEREVGFLHYRLIPLLGMALGEFWSLDALAAACRSEGRYSFLLASGVMDIPGGVGSPANAHAVL